MGRHLIEIVPSSGLEQKLTPQRMPPGKAAKAVNLVPNKAGRMDKRLGYFQLGTADPFGSGYSLSTGVALGTWNPGEGQDNLLIVGRGSRGSSSGGALATSIHTYSDDLGGPVVRGPAPDVKVLADEITCSSSGDAFSVCSAVIGDIMVTCWIDPSGPFSNPAATRPNPQPPLAQCGLLIWSAMSLSTRQIVVGPQLLDTSPGISGDPIGALAQFVRIAAVGTSFVVCYSVASPQAHATEFNGYIYAKKLAVASLTSGGTWSSTQVITSGNAAVPNPYAWPGATLLSYPGSSSASVPAGQFDMRAVIGDATSFVVAYETGTFGGNPDHPLAWTGTSIVVDRWAVANVSGGTGARTSQWVVAAAPAGTTVVGGFGVRADSTLGYVVVAWAQAAASAAYVIKAASGVYPTMTGWNTPTVVYTANDAFETAPQWLDVSYSPCGPFATGQFVVSHSPMGSCWNAAFATTQEAGAAGVSAEATANLLGRIVSFDLIWNTGANGEYAPTKSPTTLLFAPGGAYTPGTTYTILHAYGQAGVYEQVSGVQINTAGTKYGIPQSGAPFASANIGISVADGTPYTFGTGLKFGNVKLLSQVASLTVANPGVNYTAAPTVVFDSGGAGTGAAANTPTVTAGIVQGPITMSAVGSGYTSQPQVTIVDFGDATTGLRGTGATAVANPTGGSWSVSGGGGTSVASITVTAGGSGYSSNVVVFISGGASATATINSATGQVTGFTMVTNGDNYATAPTVTLVSPQNIIGLQQANPHRLGLQQVGSGVITTCWFPSNNAMVYQEMATIGTNGNPMTLNANASGSSVVKTPGVTLASCGLEANGIVYYLVWSPSLTQGGFTMMACDLSCNPNCTISGNNFPMRPVASLQTRTALADPGWGFQVPDAAPGPMFPSLTYPAAWVFQSPSGPNAWTGGSAWGLAADSYGTAYVSYCSSSLGGRMAPASGTIQTLPRQSYPMAPWNNTTAVGGALPCVFDGQNLLEQGFLYAPESILVTPVASGSLIGGGMTWSKATDSRSWIFVWEQFDSQGNYHVSARSTPVTVTGQDLLDALGAGTLGPLSSSTSYTTQALPITCGLQFQVPTLGPTMRQWPGGGSFGNDIRGYAAPPPGHVTLGVYRTTLNSNVYRRIYDRFFNGDDIGDTSFTLNPPVYNTKGGSSVLTVFDVLADEVIDGTQSAAPFPLLYGDGTNGAPGSLDQSNPPASNVLASDGKRLYIARGNQLLWTKVRSGEMGSNTPGYAEQVNSMTVGDDNAIVALAASDSKVLILKGNGNWYISGAGPADDGSGGIFQGPDFIPTDAGCVSQQSTITTPEGTYYMSNAGLRLIDRGLVVRYVGGAVEDELARTTGYSTILGATLYPQNNRLILLACQGDVAVSGGPNAGQVVGELLVRDYFLDVWTTAVVTNGAAQTGFVSAAVAWGIGAGTGFPLFLQTPAQQRLHLLGADGQVWREHDPLDGSPYFDNATYVSWLWRSPPIFLPADGDQEQTLQGRYRMRDIVALLQSQNPHGLNISVAIDYGPPGLNRAWVWNAPGQPSIAPGGVIPGSLTELRTYDGRMGSMFQVQLQDVSDPASTTGQGAQFIGLTCLGEGVRGLYRLPSSRTQ